MGGWLVGGRLALAAGQSLSFVSVLMLLPSVCGSAAAGQHGKKNHSDDYAETPFTGNNHKVINNNSRIFVAIVVTPSEFT